MGASRSQKENKSVSLGSGLLEKAKRGLLSGPSKIDRAVEQSVKGEKPKKKKKTNKNPRSGY